jgi:acyl dehydratase
MRTFTSIEDLKAAEGTELGTSEWLAIDQERINQFADATGDHQWIHVDPERAAEGPFGSTIAPGYLTLSLLPQFSWEIYTLEGVKAGINYGLNKVRFVQPVRVGSRVRSTIKLVSVTDAGNGAWQVLASHRVDVEVGGKPKPACIAETISRVVF